MRFVGSENKHLSRPDFMLNLELNALSLKNTVLWCYIKTFEISNFFHRKTPYYQRIQNRKFNVFVRHLIAISKQF